MVFRIGDKVFCKDCGEGTIVVFIDYTHQIDVKLLSGVNSFHHKHELKKL